MQRRDNEENIGPSPGSDRKIRLECLKVAVGCVDPDQASSAESLILTAMVLYRYVIDGTAPTEVKIVEMKRG